MMFRALFLALVFINQAIAGDNYLQALYDEKEADPKVFKAKALTPVHSALAFVATKDGKPLLVKLTSVAKVHWAREYVPNPGISIDVEDVYKSGLYYYICGKLTLPDKSNKGFMMRVGSNGSSSLRGMVYDDICSLNSIERTSTSDYLVVGETCDKKAVILKVKTNLDAVSGLRINENKAKSEFHKIIEYTDKKSKKKFAVVGERISNCEEKCDFRCKDTDKNLLVAVVDKDLKVKFVKHYGRPSNVENKKIDERGLSVAPASNKGGIIVTGSAETLKFKNKKNKKCSRTSGDILVSKISDEGNLGWSKRYNIQKKLDFGTEIVRKGNNVYVVGETKTKYLTISKDRKDVFLMQLNKNNGNEKRTDLFGLVSSTNNGELRGKIDMYMTTSGRPVILGNTEHPDVSSSRPYLITPSTRKDDCVSKEVEVATKNHDMETNDVDSETFTPVSKCVALKAEKVDIERKEVCKNSKSPSESPSDVPSDVPSDMPSDVPSEEPSAGPPSVAPSAPPTLSAFPTESSSAYPSTPPTESEFPSESPSEVPSEFPSNVPSDVPSESPSEVCPY